MSTVLYTVASREMLFNGTHNVEDMHKDSGYWYEGNDREKSLELARKYSNDTIEVNKSGILRDVYQWNAFEFENDVCTGCSQWTKVSHSGKAGRPTTPRHVCSIRSSRTIREYFR